MENAMGGVQPVFNLNEKATGSEGFNNSAWLWIVVLFVLLGGGFGGFGNRNGGNALTQAELQQGFDHNDAMSQLRGITNGQAESTYTLNNAINGLAQIVSNGNYNITQTMQNGFCEVNRNIDAVKAEGYRNTCEIVNAINSDGEKTRAMFSAYQMQELRDRLEDKDRQLMTANILNSQVAQTADLMQRLRPAPIPAFVVSNPLATASTTT